MTYDVVSITCDGHSSNRRFFKQTLADGQSYIDNPFKAGNRVYFSFDYVHIWKNCLNNILNRREFDCPDFDGKRLSCNFDHIKQLYELELVNGLKYAHKLNRRVIDPKATERTNVGLSNRFHHESTFQV